MSNSPSDSLMGSPYDLLSSYAHQAKIKSVAYSYSESYYRNMYKWLTYPMVVLSAISTVIAVLDVNKYILIGLNLSMLILIGFTQLIDPKNKEQSAHNISTEYNEINSNVIQFIRSNNRTTEEIKQYGEIIHGELQIWDSLAPPCKDVFIQKATILHANRSRASRRVSSKKKDLKIEIV